MTAAVQERVRAQVSEQTLRVELSNDLDRLASLRTRWEELNLRCADHEAPFFQSHAWCMHVARERLRHSPHRFRLCVALFYRGQSLVGIWPLALQRTLGAWIVKSLDDPFGQFAGVAFADPSDIAIAVPIAMRALSASGLADAVEFSNVIADTPLHRALVAFGARSTSVSAAVYVDMRDSSSFEEFARGVNKKTRKNLRNLLNRLNREAGEVQHELKDDPHDLSNLISDAFAGRLRWMQEHGRTSPAFREPDFRLITDSLADTPGLQVVGFAFKTAQEYLSMHWGFCYGGRYYAYMSSKNPQFETYSVGRLHMGMVIEACKNRGIDVLELMAPPMSYKLTWSDKTRDLHEVVLPLSFKGWLLFNPLKDRLLEAARATGRVLPLGLRRRLLNPLLSEADDQRTDD